MMHHKIIFLFLLIASLITFHVFTHLVTFPNRYLGNIDISLKTQQEIFDLLVTKEKTPVEITIRDRVYPFTLKELGIAIDKKAIQEIIFMENKKPFPQNYIAFFSAFNKRKTYLPSLIFTQRYAQQIERPIFDFSEQDDDIFFNQDTQSFTFTQYQDKYRIDSGSVKIAILKAFGKERISIHPNLLKIEPDDTKTIVKNYNEQFEGIYKEPVTIAVNDNDGIQHVKLTSDELKSVLGARVTPKGTSFTINIDEKKLQQVLSEKNKNLFPNQEKQMNATSITHDIKSLLQDRLKGTVSDTILAEVTGKANTHGEIAQKYIEIDISQQKMFLWNDGKNIAIHAISTGLYYPTPTGSFKILNKATNAFSDIYRVWMPYWMAIYLDPKINAYIGIHELPYWITGSGQQIRRPRDFLGSPHTGGCISLDIGIAKQVQDWSDIGMPVRVYN